jgi:uncharacterized protein (DUF302 family)
MLALTGPKRAAAAAIVLLAVMAVPAIAQDMATTRSASDFATTKSRLIEAVKAKGFAVVAEVDHAAGARSAGLDLPPTHLVIFGNPRGGTPLMACKRAVGLDLPLKALVWQEADGAVNVSVNTPKFISGRHALGECGAAALANMGNALQAIAADAARQ